MQHDTRVHGGESDSGAIELGDERVVARGAQSAEPVGQLGRIRWIAEMRE
jgi:hypothetical protein